MRTLIPLLSFVLMLGVALLAYLIYQRQMTVAFQAPAPISSPLPRAQKTEPPANPPAVKTDPTLEILDESQTGNQTTLRAKYDQKIGAGEILILKPKQAIQGVLLVFPGYTPPGDPHQQAPEIVAEKLQLAELAEELDYLIAIPQMNTSIYEIRYYPGTRDKWDRSGDIPGGLWVSKVLPAYLQKTFNLPAQTPFTTLGISTGAQGAIKFGFFNKIAPTYTFQGAIAISGTYDIEQEYAIHSRVLGNPRKYAQDWAQENLLRRVSEIDFPVRYYSESNSAFTLQSRAFALSAQKLKKTNISGNTELVPFSVHSWDFWANSILRDQIKADLQSGLKDSGQKAATGSKPNQTEDSNR